jgi:uncharacterized membrane protein YcjF (UPF0283 family)
VNLKIIEVVVLLFAGVVFVAWQFRDLRRAKEITRLKREAEKQQAMQHIDKSDEALSATFSQSDRQ